MLDSATAKVPKEEASDGETDIRSGTDSHEPITNIGISWTTSPTLTTRLSSPAGSNSDSEPMNMIWKHLISKAEANQSSGTRSVVNAETEDKEFHRILDDVFPPASKAPGDEHQNEDEYHGSEAFSQHTVNGEHAVGEPKAAKPPGATSEEDSPMLLKSDSQHAKEAHSPSEAHRHSSWLNLGEDSSANSASGEGPIKGFEASPHGTRKDYNAKLDEEDPYFYLSSPSKGNFPSRDPEVVLYQSDDEDNTKILAEKIKKIYGDDYDYENYPALQKHVQKATGTNAIPAHVDTLN
ncbi:hypothetical protein PGT21_026685 [Puccinia graminis f. sp. tritici]|uniref:Uncharacterized protein n=1 Tax=Puccinia graminis f. sp. tritici TaxID=56615 RepID=A0A5B0SB41_PUCGR|nr:hypothetical protein PGT21_026685 [Puccinia graminis f. sp. tritici]KAA1135037.1 hypothetical protein PGTUg99_014292 [Puccinia graminis f. sp. tritici]